MKKSIFYRIYFSAIAIFLVLLTAALFLLNSWLKAYEQAQPHQAANRIVEQYIKTNNLYELKQSGVLKVSNYETAQTLSAALESKIAGADFQIFSSRKNDEYDAVYAVKNGETTFMTLYFKQDDRVVMGNRGYVLAHAEFNDDIYRSYSITMPQDAQVTVNGYTLADSERKNMAFPLNEKYKDEQRIEKQTCVLEGFVSENPVITASINQVEISVTEKNGVYSVSQNFDKKVSKAIYEFATDASQTYAKYMQNDTYLGAVAKYMDTSSEFYQNVRTSLVIFALDHNGYDFENVSATELHRYSDNLYSCRISFTQVLHLGKDRYRDSFDKYIYLKKSGNSYKVIDMRSVGENSDE